MSKETKSTIDRLIENYKSATTDEERGFVDGVMKQFVDEEEDVYRQATYIIYYEKNKVKK